MDPSRFPREMVFLPGAVPVLSNRHVLNGDLEPHDHAFHEVALVLSGEGRHVTIRGESELRRGQVIVLRQGEWHSYRKCRSLVVQNCIFGEEIAANELAWMGAHAELVYLLARVGAGGGTEGPAVLQMPDDALKRSLAILRPLSKYAQGQGVQIRGILVGHLILFLAELSRHLDPAQLAEAHRSAAAHPAVQRAIALMRDDPAEEWTIADLCGRLHGVDPSYFSRQFRRATGYPPLAWLTRQRAGVAAALLLRTNKRISEIGGIVGWTDPNHFARRFRSVFGLSPSEYRRRGAVPPSD